MLLSKAIAGYWLDKRRALSPRTVRDYELAFDRLVKYLDDPEMGSIGTDDVRRFVSAIQSRRNLKAKSVINLQIALSSLWTWAVRELGVTHAVRGISRPRWTPPTIEVLSKTEIVAMLAACSHNAKWRTRTGKTASAQARPTATRDRAIILTLLDTGIRASELTGLTVGDLYEESGRLHIRHGKGDKSRNVYLGNAAQRAIWRYMASRTNPAPADPLFAARSGRPLHRDNLGDLIGVCAERAGIGRNVHPHMFRHTFAVTFLRNGGNLIELQDLLGHANMTTLRIYVRLAQTDLRATADRNSPADRWNL
jgi:integrase/recombinase XerD